MNSKKILNLVLVTVLLGVFPTQVLATEAGGEAKMKEESAQISSEIDQALTSVNKTYQEIESLKVNVEKTETKITKLKEKITSVEDSIDKRVAAMGKRMQTIQVNNSSVSTDFVDALIEAEGVSDFVSRLHAVNVIQDAENSKVDSLTQDKEKLETLKEDLTISQSSLKDKQSNLESQKTQLEGQVKDLKSELASNESALNKLKESNLAKEAVANKVLAEEKAKETPESKEAPKQNTQKEAATPVSPTKPTAPVTSGGGGRTLTMAASAYSYTEAGLTPFTALGIDLRQNSKVVAVDPSVIPLGSVVEVSGYGMAIAGDTGGAIKGNRIDLHFNSVQECLQFGRQTVTVTVQ